MQPAALLEELGKPAPIPSVPMFIPTGLPSDLLRRRPDIRAAEARLHSDTAAVGVAEADLFPKFNLNGSIGTAAPTFGGLFSWNQSAWSVGPSVSWPLFDAGRIRSNIELRKAIREESLITYQQTVLRALQDVESALIAYEKEQLHREALVQAVKSSRDAVDASLQLYAQGLTEFLNVLSAQRSLYASENALANSDQAIATNLVAVYKALGGGWEENDAGAATTRPAPK
jgi:NodT family efflux transporter outer membrane factor (OMF) lipoprotein